MSKILWRTQVSIFALILVLQTNACSSAFAEPGSPETYGESIALAIPEITKWDEVSKPLKLERFKGQKFQRNIKIAIIDNGFNGYKDQIGKTLPENTIYHEGPESAADSLDNLSFHGLFMAQIVTKVITSSEAEADFELHLYNAYGYTKFAAAVEDVANNGFALVLYSQVWEYGGNGDGKGFINTLVNKVLDKGTVWINAAGNFGRQTKLVPIEGKGYGDEDWVIIKTTSGKYDDGISFSCAPTKGDTCLARIVLSWNDFKDDADTGTDKDLDMFIIDSKKNIVESSERNQKLAEDLNDPKASLFPRELIETKLAKGIYKVRAKIKSRNFAKDKAQMRLTLSGSGVSIDYPTTDETLLPPADNERVIAIGASDDPQSSRSKSRSVPKVYLRSLIPLKDGSDPFATSNAAAMAVGLAVLHMGTEDIKTTEEVLEKLKIVDRGADEFLKQIGGNQKPPVQRRRTQPNPFPMPDMEPRKQQVISNGCIQPVSLPIMSQPVDDLLRRGSVGLRFRGRPTISVPDRLIDRIAQVLRFPGPPMRIVVSGNGYRLVRIEELDRLPPGHYEIRRFPETPICR